MTSIRQALMGMLPRKSSLTDKSNNIIVRLEQGSREPVTPVEQLTVSVLSSKGTMSLRTLAERVASELYHQELRNGAQVLDIGLFGSRLFLPDVISEIEARNGTLWRIENREKC
jgi:hypothetical protein